MHKALVKDGLFADEAAAMLETWKQSYFQSSGKRIFYIMPRAWTDRVMPLRIHSSAHQEIDLERSMVGRIELMTERHQALLER